VNARARPRARSRSRPFIPLDNKHRHPSRRHAILYPLYTISPTPLPPILPLPL